MGIAAPLEFARLISEKVNAAWEDGSYLDNVTPTTRALLSYWFDPAYTEMRDMNFHKGQRQAILNIIYIHEVLKKDKIIDVYQEINPELLMEHGMGISKLSDPTLYGFPKYCVKMATGTGKTWVLEALILWQYLNAKHEEGNYTKNFLIVAPGLIVYDRLQDAFLGRNKDNGLYRDADTNDYKLNEELFIPEEYRNEFYGFLNSCTISKTEIGNRVTGDGVLAITNYHLLMGVDDVKDTGEDSWKLPVMPGVAAGNDLNVLDSSLKGKRELEYLRSLPELMVFNDEAHHIHDNKKSGEVSEVEWQKSLRYIAETKEKHYMQIDFSATPYTQTTKEKIYFPHIVVDFELTEAIRSGLVKTIVLDERKELAEEELDFKAERDEKGRVLDLSEGQQRMLSAGLKKLDILTESFKEVDETKVPKMLVMCEDTEVVPLVSRFLKSDCGLNDDDILEVHSNKKNEVGEEEWNDIKVKLFALDKYKKPKVVISVLMLREGFDVNNICVVVPLRSTTSNILLEQTIGRGLRLMWRGNPEIDEAKRENRKRIMQERKSAINYYDVLSIVEHPAFKQFYQELLDGGLIGVEDEIDSDEKVKGDIVTVGLKDNYKEYDFNFPFIMKEPEEVVGDISLNVSKLDPIRIPLESLKKIIPDEETWRSIEITEDVNVGDYSVTYGVMKATSYNDYLMRLVKRITEKQSNNLDKLGRSKKKNNLPTMGVQIAKITEAVDKYIRTVLFKQTINPMEDNLWRVLRIKEVIDHIVGQINKLIIEAQESVSESGKYEVKMIPLSSVDKITVRENYMLDIRKCIYEYIGYPSNKGIFERDFMEFCDRDGKVDALCKIIEARHTFVRFRYMRESGMPAQYIPDFFVRFGDDIYLVETKADKDLSAENVIRKKRAALAWVERINNLPSELREGKTWHYALLGDATFYEWRNKKADVLDMLRFSEIKENEKIASGRLF